MSLLPFSGPVIPTPVPISKGGTGSATQNFVDLSSTAQTKTGSLTIGSTAAQASLTFIAPTSGHTLQIFTDQFNSRYNASAGAHAFNQTVIPSANNTQSLGGTSNYWLAAYATTLNLNSTASLSGGTSGQVGVTGTLAAPFILSKTGNPTWNLINTNDNSTYGGYAGVSYTGLQLLYDTSFSNAGTRLYIGCYGSTSNATAIGTSSSIVFTSIAGFRTILDDGSGNMVLSNGSGATHTLTLGSTATGIAYYNTSDQTTNYERLLINWNSNKAQILTYAGGTGTIRNLVLGTQNRSIVIADSASGAGFVQFNNGTSGANGYGAVFSGTWTASSGVNAILALTPTINQSSTAGYTALLVNPTETATGSGTKLLADFQVGGSSKLNISDTGVMQYTQNTTGSGSAALGANSPAVTNTAPYTWLQMTSSDGSTVYVPAWK